MLHRMKLTTTKLSSISSSLRPIQQASNNYPNPFITISYSTSHPPNQPTLKKSDLNHSFDCIENIDEAAALFHYMLQFKPIPPIQDFNKLFRTILRIKHHSQLQIYQHYSLVIHMFKKLTLLGCMLNEYTMNIVVNCYCKLKQVDLCFAVIASFIKRGYAPDIVTFNCLIRGFFLKGNVARAVGLFKNLIRSEVCVVDEYTVATVLDGLAKSGNVGDALELLQLSERRELKLDGVCYNIVIDGLCKGGMLKDGMEVLLRMADRDFLPDVVSYTCLMHGLCMNGELDFACGIFNDLTVKGICPNVITYTVMIQGLCRNGLFQDARNVLEKMVRVGCLPNSVTYNIIVQACLHHRDSSDSINLLKQIVGRDFQLDAPSFFVLLRQIGGVYDDDVIVHLLRKLVSSDVIRRMQGNNDEFGISSLIHKLNCNAS